MSFNEKLIDFLKTDSRFIDDEGEILVAAVLDHAWKIDHALAKLLLSDKEIKSKFFEEIDGHWIFNINTFIDYISQKNFLDNSYTRFRNLIGLTVDDKYLRERGDVALVWPYKDCILEGGQTKEEEGRNEIVFNEVLAQDEINRLLAPKTLTTFKRHTAKGIKNVTDFRRDDSGVIRENMIIKGNNLLALHALKTQFRGQVKLIYIDPPYNIGNDSFRYNDKFNHSTWLTFMKNRLEIARDLLSRKGAIFVSVNHVELGYLLVLMDEIFSRANKLPIVTLRSGTTASYRSINECPVNVSEYLVGYKASEEYKSNPVYVESDYTEDYSHLIKNRAAAPEDWKLENLNDYIHKKDECRDWREFKKKNGPSWKQMRFEMKKKRAFENPDAIVSLNTLQKPSDKILRSIQLSKSHKDKVHVVSGSEKSQVYCYNGRTLAFFSKKMREINGETIPSEILTNIWEDVSFLGIGPEGNVDLPNGKKPELLVKHLIDLTITSTSDIVMDFHVGTGTTCAVAHKMKCQYIGIEQLDYGRNDVVARLTNVIKGDMSGISEAVNWQGGGEFISFELMKYNQVFMERVQNAKTSDELVRIWREMAEGSFLNWYVNPEMPDEAVKDFKDLGKGESGFDKQKRLLVELLDKNQLFVNLSEIDDSLFNVSKEDKALNKAFYGEKQLA